MSGPSTTCAADRIACIVTLTVCLLTTVASGADADADADDPAATATDFTRAFFADDPQSLSPMLDATMRTALAPAQVTALRAQLGEAHGKVQAIADAWHEDDIGVYRRYRVPVTFERTTLDTRVVLDRAGLVAGLFFVAHVEPVRERRAVTAPVREVQVTVGDEARGLPGTLSLPDGRGPFPGVVLVHGSGPNDRDETIGPNKPFRDLAWGLAQRGVAVLRYDKRSFAQPDSLTALGDALTVRQEVVDDARLAAALLRARREVDDKRVFVLGHSLGGTLAPRIAEGAPPPAGLIILAGATLPLPEKSLEQLRYIFGLDRQISGAEREQLDNAATAVAIIRSALDGKSEPYAGYRLGAPFGYFRDLEGYDAPATAARLGLPTLVLQGVRDYQVTVDGDFPRFRAALANKPHACLVVYPELDHLFFRGAGPSSPADYQRPQHVDKQAIDDIAGFIVVGRCPGRTD